MADLIDRQAAIKLAIDLDYESRGILKESKCREIENRYNMIPSAQPDTARRVVGRSRSGITMWYECDTCHEPVDAQDNFCSGCGRRLNDG